MVVNKTLPQIVCTAFSNEKKHDFRLLKESSVHLAPNQTVLTDTGYQGLAKIRQKNNMPNKKSLKKPLTSEDKNKARTVQPKSSKRTRYWHD